MSLWVFLALASSLGDALVGYIDEWLLQSLKNGGDDNSVDAPGKLLLISACFGGVTAVTIIAASAVLPSLIFDFSVKAILFGIGAGVFEVLWLIPYFHAINRSGALDATPVLQSIPIFAGLFGLFLFNEVPTLTTVLGTILIISGALLLNYSPRKRSINIETLLLMTIASALAALQLLLFKTAAEVSTIFTAVALNGIGMFVVSALIWSALKSYRLQFNAFCKSLTPRLLLLQGINETLYTVSAICGQIAVVLGPSVMAASALSALHPAFTLLIGITMAALGSSIYHRRLSGFAWLFKLPAIILIALGALLVVIH